MEVASLRRLLQVLLLLVDEAVAVMVGAFVSFCQKTDVGMVVLLGVLFQNAQKTNCENNPRSPDRHHSRYRYSSKYELGILVSVLLHVKRRIGNHQRTAASQYGG